MPIVAPLDWVEDLWDWKAPEEPSKNLELTNYSYDKLAKGEREIMVCHDMKGGYLEEELDEGYPVPSDCNPYVFLNWWNIDVFCYFSHHFVTIPPAGYVNTAHKHGCLVMGTLITEWKPGMQKCAKMLENEEAVARSVKQLVEIAAYHKFDGWLINIENKITAEQLPLLKLFLEQLTFEMRSRLTNSRVIWYDSVIANGSLIWQNQLNPQNSTFYDSCDGIYLNYNWTDEMLLSSADYGDLARIYVGIDVFGRGCIGGWDCHRPFSKIALIRMSLALFAPGWVAEKFPQEDPIEINLRFWRKVRPFVVSRPITQLPISTDFCAGFRNEGKHFSLNQIEIQPHFDSSEIRPLLYGGVQIEKAGVHRIFYCDMKVTGCVTVEIECEEDLEVMINGEKQAATKKNAMYIAKIENILHIRSVDFLTEKPGVIVRRISMY